MAEGGVAPGTPDSPGAVAVVIPAFRAAAAVADVIAGVLRAIPGAAVIVVDDGSGDDTAALARAAGASVLSLGANLGKGRALATGLAAAVALEATRYVVTLDADGQHPPGAIPQLLEPLEAGTADLVVGARARDRRVMPAPRRFSNWLSSSLASRVIGASISDSQSGFRAMTRAVAAAVQPSGRRYEYETEFLFAAAAAGFRLAAVPIPTVYAGAASHFRTIGDTLALARVFLRHWPRILLGAPKGRESGIGNRQSGVRSGQGTGPDSRFPIPDSRLSQGAPRP